MDHNKTTIIINPSSSQCGGCHKGVSADAVTHDTIVSYGTESGNPGCGVRYTHVSSMYWELLDRVAASRPDLTLSKF